MVVFPTSSLWSLLGTLSGPTIVAVHHYPRHPSTSSLAVVRPTAYVQLCSQRLYRSLSSSQGNRSNMIETSSPDCGPHCQSPATLPMSQQLSTLLSLFSFRSLALIGHFPRSIPAPLLPERIFPSRLSRSLMRRKSSLSLRLPILFYPH